MSGGGGGSNKSTTNTVAEPWKGVRPFLESAYPAVTDLYGTAIRDPKGKVTGFQLGEGPQYYPGQTIASPDMLERAGQEWQLGATPFASSIAGYGQGGIENMLGYATSNSARGGEAGAIRGMDALLAAGDPTTNPYFQSTLQAAMRPVTEQFTEQVLPGLRRDARVTGSTGSTRQGIAEGLATRGYMNTLGDIATNMGNQAYGQGLGALQAGAGIGTNMLGMGLDAAGRAAALAPQVQQMGFVPGQMAERIGQQRTADNQAQIDADIARWNYGQQLPYNQMSDYLALLNAAPGGSTASAMSAPGRSTLGSMLGGGLMGAGLMAGTPYMLPGALAGGMLGLF